MTGSDLVQAVSGTVIWGQPESVKIQSLAEPGSTPLPQQAVMFLINEGFAKNFSDSPSALVVQQGLINAERLEQWKARIPLIIESKEAYLGLARFSAVLLQADPTLDWLWQHQHCAASPVVVPGPNVAQISEKASVGERTTVGEGTKIFPNVVVGHDVVIGKNCTLFPGVVIYPRTIIGNGVRIHANTVIGSDGFGYVPGRGLEKIWHLGRVIIKDDVEIGSCTTIDRGTIRDTIIEQGAKIDNLVQIGHNGHLKPYSILCSQVGLAGNVTIGQGTILAGQVGVADKLTIGNAVKIGAKSGIMDSIGDGEIHLSSMPARPHKEWMRTLALFFKLPDLYQRLKSIESRLTAIDKERGL